MTLLALALWLSVGGCTAAWIDASEMKLPVPYGELPSYLPLKVYRRIMTVLALVLGPPALIYFGTRYIVSFVADFYKLCRAAKRADRKGRQINGRR